ncbi:MAG: hypothetical protein INR72_13275, partial [Williamsia herbipolensis]|nr:hypothetical protein [Williamsia herbipolensis]
MSTTQDVSALSAAQQELLRRRLDTLSAAPRRSIEARPEGATPPLSFAQERVWFMEQLAPGTAAYLTPQVFHFPAGTDPQVIVSAWRAVVARHEALRMVFPADADGAPTVRILSMREIPDPVTETVATQQDAERRTDEIATATFDLATGPLLRTALLVSAGSAGSGDHSTDDHSTGDHSTDDHGTDDHGTDDHGAGDLQLVVGMHHIVTDGWSNDVLLTELRSAVDALAAGRTIPWIDETPVQYGDFAEYQRRWCERPETAEHVRYWVDRLAAVPPLALPTDHPRPVTQQFDGQAHTFRIPQQDVVALDEWARSRRATQFMALVTAYQIVLARFAGQWDFAVGSPVAGRSSSELDQVVGMFVNMLPLRTDLDPTMTVDEALEATRARVLEALSHEQVPFERVVQQLGLVRDPSRPPLFQAMVVLQNYTSFADPAAEATGADKKLLSEGRITEEGVEKLRSLMFHEMRRPHILNTELNFDAVRRFCWGLGADNPLWLDQEYAAASVYEGPA